MTPAVAFGHPCRYKGMATNEDDNPLHHIDAIERGKSKKKQGKPTAVTQMATLLERMDKQADQTERILSLMDAARHQNPATPCAASHKVVESSVLYSPGSGGHHAKKKVYGSRIKRTSPKNGIRAHARRSVAQSDILWSSSSSGSDSPDTKAQVKSAIGMLNTRFSKHRGNSNKKDDRVNRYRPFMYLDKERQREIIRGSHPVELTVNQHLGGLCAMAIEELEPSHPAAGIVAHIAQILDDIEFMPWNCVRAFSNTVINNVARQKWWWGQDRCIEQCRTNQYMRHKITNEPYWSVPCPMYNRGRCAYDDSHNVGEVYMKHVYGFCVNYGQESGHTSRTCYNKKKQGGQGTQGMTGNYHRRDARGVKAYSANKADGSDEYAKN